MPKKILQRPFTDCYDLSYLDPARSFKFDLPKSFLPFKLFPLKELYMKDLVTRGFDEIVFKGINVESQNEVQ